MENNNYNDNYTDNYNSDNNASAPEAFESNEQSNTYEQRNGNEQSNTYERNSNYAHGNDYGYQSSYGSGGTYAQGMYQNPAGNVRNEKRKKEKKPGNFGIKLLKCAAIALVFGLVAGVSFEGVRLLSTSIFGGTSDVIMWPDNILNQYEGELNPTDVSSTYVATDVSDVVAEVMPSIVAITNISQTEYRDIWNGNTQTYESVSAGSGIIVSKNSKYLYIVTNNHVVSGATTLTVAFSDNATVNAEIKGTDPSTDLAVIYVEIANIPEETRDVIKVATLGNSDKLKVGEAAIAIGNALGYGQSVTTGCISALDRLVSVSDSASGTRYTAELIQTDAAINPGNSGGALLNALGEVIGINSVKYTNTSVEGIGYAIPISAAMPIIEDLITKEKVEESERSFLGIAGVDVTEIVGEAYGMPIGIYVVQVTEGSGAEQGGIKQGDIITAFDGKQLTTMDELQRRLEYYKAGTTVNVTVMRAADGQYVEQVLTVTLGRKN